MRSMTNLEYSVIKDELQVLVGNHFSKIYMIENGYLIKIGKYSIVCNPGIHMNLTMYAEESLGLDTLCQRMRKELDNSRLLSLSQVNKDRILLMEFQDANVYFEMFGKGNVVLVKNDLILESMKREDWSNRSVRPGNEYHLPNGSVAENLDDVLSDRYIIVSMLKLPLGKPYVVEILKRAGINERKPGNQLSQEEVDRIKEEMSKLLDSLSPVVFYEDGKALEFGLTIFTNYDDARISRFNTLCDACDSYFHHQGASENPKITSLKTRLLKQKKRLKDLKDGERISKEKGDFIYAHFQEVEKILEKASSSKIDDLEDVLLEYNAKVDKKNKKIEVEL